MVTSDNYYEKKIKNSIGKRFTQKEAIEFEREMINSPTGTNNYTWFDSKTKQPIAFNY
jgi:hypothetical protein